MAAQDRMQLLDVQAGQVVRVVAFHGRGLTEKLQRMGLYAGDELILLRKAPLGGPVLVSAGGREVALGRGVAQKITVEAV
jgi:Fe2+ transport system protein FeoA